VRFENTIIMIPIADSEKVNRTPWINFLLIFINITAFVYLFFYSTNPETMVVRYGFIPARFFAEGWNPLHHWQKYIPLVTANFIHGSLFHIIGNLIFLFIFGDNIEDKLGHFRYLVFYLACGIISIMGQSYDNPGSTALLVGASGAIAGVMGAFYILFPSAKVKSLILFFTQEIPAIYYLLIWFLFNLARGLFPTTKIVEPVAWWAHITGFIAGALLVNLFLMGAPKVKAHVKVKTSGKPSSA
jgi:membrane associated rhomboid family serine protease